MDTYIAIVESKYEKTDVVHALGSLGEIAELFSTCSIITHFNRVSRKKLDTF